MLKVNKVDIIFVGGGIEKSIQDQIDGLVKESYPSISVHIRRMDPKDIKNFQAIIKRGDKKEIEEAKKKVWDHSEYR
eukprot:UN08551